MHISHRFENVEKPDIGGRKPDIQETLEKRILQKKTKEHVIELIEKYGSGEIFARMDVERTTGLKSSRASEMIRMLLDEDVIETVAGQGKGRYRFR